MNIKSSLSILFLFFITSHAFAIDPVYEGVNGIREKVFATNCLDCHSSNLTGPARNGAPPSVNWDTYESTIQNASRAIVRAVDQMTMPPFSSGIPLLNQEQKAAMLAWESAGFPSENAGNSSFEGTILTIPVINAGNQKFRAALRLIALDSSPSGYGFVLESAQLTTGFSENEATFFPENGQVILPFVEIIQNGISQSMVSANMTLVAGSDPLLFTLTSYTVIPGSQVSSAHLEVLKQLHLPDGFKISIYADNVPDARSLASDNNGIVFVGTKSKEVYAIQDSNNDGVADKQYLIASGLNSPNGVAYKDGSLYVGEINRIIRFDNITQQLANPPEPVVVYNQFPSDAHHGWKYLRFGPDNKLYTAVGAPCNICIPENNYASLYRLNPDGSQIEIIARGIRNTVGFDWQSGTNALFFTDNGRDYLGDDAPPDELNQWSVVGEHFGYPYCHGGDIPDPDFPFPAGKNCTQFKAPVWKFKAHVATLGIRFYQGQQFPAEFNNQLFVAEHGSWNRTVPQGYNVSLVKFDQGKPVTEQNFISGWLTEDGKVLGRPVDILDMPDGSLLVSDDTLDVIYKVEYIVPTRLAPLFKSMGHQQDSYQTKD